LVELGFLTNAVEEDFLNSENGKSYMSSAIFRGFKEYKELVEDPLPEGYVEPAIENNNGTPLKSDAEKAIKEAEKARQDSILKVANQAKLKAVADSLEQAKQQLLEEKKRERKNWCKKAKDDKKANAESQG